MKRSGRPELRTARPVAKLRAGRTDWYKITNNKPKNAADVMIYDEIGYFGVTAADFVNSINELQVATINLHLNTPGGDAFDGIAIYNSLRFHPAVVNVFVDGWACSAGSIIAMAGDRVTMRRASQMMIHNAQGLAIGRASEMREMANLLDRLSADIASTYMARAGGTADQWLARMDKETWYSGPEAVAAGLADESEDESEGDSPEKPGEELSNTWDMTIFAYAGRESAPAPDLPVAPITCLACSKELPSPDAQCRTCVPETALPEDFAETFRLAMKELNA